jgi:ferredoxin
MSATPSRTDPTGGLRVDRVSCTGHGVCATLLPGTVRLDEWGYPVILDERAGATDDGEQARATAIRLCPAMALYRTSSVV